MVLTTNYSKIPCMLRALFLALLLSYNIADTFAQQVTISNNLLYDAWLTPNYVYQPANYPKLNE